MEVEANSIFEVRLLEELEAQSVFRQFAGISDDADPELHKIGEDIVKRCGGLPIAIKTIASTLKYKRKDVWKNALSRLEHHELDDNVHEIFEMSYNNLEEEEKEIFLLCGLFPVGFDIPMEDLMSYGWGLKLFDKRYGLRVARYRLKAWIDRLIHANLLIESDYVGCVKMHDLLLAYVLSFFSKVGHASMVDHGNMSEWPTTDTSESYKRISLKCKGMSEFPRELKYPNLSLLRLTDGDKSLRFPKDFYERMETLQLIAYEKMEYPLLPGSLQCPTNLRALCLNSCSLMDDLSPIGNLKNLEILRFARCGIRKLPSQIGKLKKLRSLDLTGCIDLQIDDGILEKLHHLEELYMRSCYGKAIRFTDTNYNELQKLSELFALEVEFFKNKAESKNAFFKNLERFRISMGRYLDENTGKDMYSFENTLMLDTNRDELLESRINELFDKTKVLHLKVIGMNDIQDVLVESLHPLPQSLFDDLRVLNFSECADLRYLFTLPVARGLSKLEHLTISLCPVLEELVHIEDNRAEMITFPKLEFLSLDGLPTLVSLCKNVDAIELPQLVELRLRGLPGFTSIFPKNKTTTISVSSNISAMHYFFNEEVAIPNLEKLEIGSMENLKEIWTCQFSNICRLREIRVDGCDGLVNLFPTNPMPWLLDLEFLGVKKCGSIEVIFDMDMGCIYEIEQGSSSLRHIEVSELVKLREVWRIKGVNSSHSNIHDFQAITHIKIERCKSFRNLFTPTTANFDLGAVEYILIDGGKPRRDNGKKNELVESSTSINTNTPGQQCNVISNEGTSGVEVVFEIRSASSSSRELATTENNQQLLLLPQLKGLALMHLEWMSHVWKCNWNNFLFPQQQQLESPLHNLTNIRLFACDSIKYLFSPLMAKLLPNLETVDIKLCKGIEEVVSNRDDEDEEMSTSTSSHTNTAFFPHLHTLELGCLPRLKRISGNEGGGRSNAITSDVFQLAQVAVASWSLFEYPRNLYIDECNALSSVIPAHALGQLQKLEELNIWSCHSMVEVFETQGTGNIANVGEGSGVTGIVSSIPRMKNMNSLKLPNLKILRVGWCNLLRHIFTSSTLESLKQLEELEITNCMEMQVIVKEEDGEHTTSSKIVVFPRLKSLTLIGLPNLLGFFMGMNDFRWPLLDMVKIDGCPQMMVFTSGYSIAPKLSYMHTSLGKHSLECGLNFHLTTTTLHENPFPSLYSTLKGIPWSFSNLIEVDVLFDWDIINIIPSNELLQLQKLEKIHLYRCGVEEVFEVLKEKNSGLNEPQSAVKFPKLREVNLEYLSRLKYMWKSNQRTVLEFPSLTRVSISKCNRLEHAFTCSMVGSLLQLQELHISECKNMEVIVKETEDSETRVKMVMFPCLKSLQLENLHSLKGFCLGKEDFMWPSLDTLKIMECLEITVFTNGQSTTPELKVIDTSFGLCYAKEDPNSFIKTKKQEGFNFTSFTSVHEYEIEDDC